MLFAVAVWWENDEKGWIFPGHLPTPGNLFEKLLQNPDVQVGMGQVPYEFTMLLYIIYDWGNNHPLTSYDMGSVWVPFGHRFDPKPYGPQ